MQHKSFGSLAFGSLAFNSLSLAAIAPLVLAAPARADALNWTYSPATHQLEITVSGGTPRYFLAAEPARIVLDLPNTEVDPIATQQTYSTGAIRQIRIAQFQPGQARLVMELAPGTVLAPGQVELRRINGDRWVLRPLLLGETAASETAASPAPSPAATSSPSSPIPRTIATPSMVFPGAIAPETSATPTPANSDASLPPLEPGALAIPVEAPPTQPSASQSPVSPAPSSPSAISLSVPPPVSDASGQSNQSSQPSQPSQPIAPTPADLPPAAPASNRDRVTIRVPAIASPPVRSSLPAAPSRSLPSLPSFQPAPTPAASSPPVYLSALPPVTPSSVIEFGQPLGNLAAAKLLIPAGTVLNLRHAGRDPIALSDTDTQQEVLLLDEAVRDRSGNIIIPADSEVIGRFETNDAGSQFIAQSINWQDQSLLLNAESDVLRGDRRLLGLLGRSRLRRIQPNQVVKVRVMEDLVRLGE